MLEFRTVRLALTACLASLALAACGVQEPGDDGFAEPDILTGVSEQALNEHSPRYIVRAAEGRSFSDLVAAIARQRGNAMNVASQHGIGLAVLPNDRAADALASDADVAYVERDRVWTVPDVRASKKPDRCPPACDPQPDPDPAPDGGTPPPPPSTQSVPWGIAKVRAPEAWGTATGSGVVVAVLDTGIYADHPDLIVSSCKNFTRQGGGSDSLACVDGHGHGTHVAGTIAAVNDDAYVVGVAPEAELWAYKVLSDSGSGWTSEIIAAVYAATDAGADVINMSLGGGGKSQSFSDACDYAETNGVFVAAAAGNSGDGDGTTDEIGYPAAYPGAISVGATTSTDGIASFSSSNEFVELSAPGVGVESTSNVGGLATYSGTSMATPHVAGAAALLMSVPGATNARARCALAAGAVNLGDPGRDNEFGHGRIDLVQALSRLGTCP